MSLLESDFSWSFSKLALLSDCPYSFYLRYIVHGDDEEFISQENAFGQYGTLAHQLLEEWAKGELQAENLADEWDRRYSTVITASFPPFPKTLPLKCYQAGLEYFQCFSGFGDIEIMEVEQKFSMNIGSYVFHGIADLVYRDRETGALTVMDHKSKSAASMKKDLPLYTKQLYLYAKHVFEAFGEFPSLLRFNMFKAGNMIDIPFSMAEYEEALRWAEDTIDVAYMEDTWPAKYNSYRCSFICDVRGECSLTGGGAT